MAAQPSQRGDAGSTPAVFANRSLLRRDQSVNAFLWTMVAVFVIGILGKATILLTQDTTRNLGLIPFDILCELGLLVWAVYLLR
jgi:hypothetical protein